jgi:plasmid stabilization system protein ParE
MTEPDDLVARLRYLAENGVGSPDDMGLAADAIEARDAEIARLRAAADRMADAIRMYRTRPATRQDANTYLEMFASEAAYRKLGGDK